MKKSDRLKIRASRRLEKITENAINYLAVDIGGIDSINAVITVKVGAHHLICKGVRKIKRGLIISNNQRGILNLNLKIRKAALLKRT